MCHPHYPLAILALAALFASGAETPPPADVQHVQHIDLVHFSHTDYGFTDHPVVCRELQMRFLDLAIDGALATRDRAPAERLYWTAETTIAIWDWWQAAPAERREQFLRAVDSGQLEISALPLNATPFLNQDQWHTMLHWLPDELWDRVRPQAAIQNDVNGFPRAGAVALLDRGIHYLFSGINEDSGGPPMPRPSAFWWKMPDGRRLLVYLNYSYPAGYWFFEPIEWRRGPVPRAGDTRFRPPRAGDFLAADEASVRRAHQHLLARLKSLEAEGYHYPRLVLSITNQWRIDNDPPFLPLGDFVGTWTRLGLKPTLRLTTVGPAMESLQQVVGDQVPTHEGEWTDWWANGTASAPREVAASRLGKRTLAAATSPVWGDVDPNTHRAADGILRDLALFDEHTWGSSNSVALPYSLDAQAQFSEKAAFAYRPMARAEWLLAQRARVRLARDPEGLYVANTARLPWSGWVTMPASALREEYRVIEDPESNRVVPIVFENGLRPFTAPANPGELTRENTAATFPDNAPRQVAQFWVDSLPAASIRRLRLSTQELPPSVPPPATLEPIERDAGGWPTGVTWRGMPAPLFTEGLGDFVSVTVSGFAPRWRARDIWTASDQKRETLRAEMLKQVAATPVGPASVEHGPYQQVFTQWLSHPRLAWANRRLEIWKHEPRARLTVRLNRLSSEDPEAFFIGCTLPCAGVMPQTSCGGQPFVPFTDQLPGTCRDYFGIDGWVEYRKPEGRWLWISRDAPLVTFGGPQVLAKRREPPRDVHCVLAMVFNNFWYTNFVGDSHGVMEFQFDLAWSPAGGPPAEHLAETLQAEPTVLIQPALAEDPLVIQRLYTP